MRGCIAIEGFLAESEICQHHMTVLVQHDVLRLKVPAASVDADEWTDTFYLEC